MIVGIDHGYGVVKTANFSFKTGITAYENEPYTKQNVIKYKDKYYVCGSGRQSLVRDKTQDNSYFILTLLAIAKEMECRNAGTKASITIAAGLPLTGYGRDKERFIAYLKQSSFQHVKFLFRDIEHKLSIDDVLVFPQGYSALIDNIAKLKSEPSIIVCDVGSWTVDVMRLDNGIPNADTCRSLELGIIRMIDEILEQVRRATGLSITSPQVEQILAGRPCSINSTASKIVHEQGKKYVDKLIKTLLESGFDVGAVPVIFLGGGAAVVKQNVDKTKVFDMTVVEDIRANAKGFESIARNMLKED